ncbi:MAG TPA: lamin tail domain-containing protein [Bacteroidales bacterium]|nr:lamin tail domain-containing protein [Bacteroidales bacterium]
MMNKKKKIILFLIILIVNLSCKKTEDPIIRDVVINELMPVNSTIAADQNGEYDDWIELFNLSSSTKDISGYYLTDNKSNISKWQIPQGTSISANGYLIIWADKDTTQIGLHANFKLSSLGEEVLFSKPNGTVIDEIIYPGQTLEVSYSRYPNGTGAFRWQNPTFNVINSTSK